MIEYTVVVGQTGQIFHVVATGVEHAIERVQRCLPAAYVNQYTLVAFHGALLPCAYIGVTELAQRPIKL